MADVRREPRLPPIETPFLEADGRTISKAWYRYLQGERGFSDNVNSGATAAALAAEQARADAATAQATADAAAQATADVADATLTFTLTANRASVFGSRLGTGSVTTNSVTVTESGGTGPYTYAWAYVSGDAGFSANSPTAATTTFTGSITALGQDKIAVWRCTVTDSLLATASVTVGVSIAEIS
jgi:hypothetical protein